MFWFVRVFLFLSLGLIYVGVFVVVFEYIVNKFFLLYVDLRKVSK